MGRDTEVCVFHASFASDIKEIKDGVKSIDGRLGDGKVTLATLSLRVDQLERIVYGAVAVSLLSLAGAILALVLKHQGG